MYECMHCGQRTVSWDADFNFEDFGYEGEGIVHICHCSNCGAEIEYRITLEEEDTSEFDAKLASMLAHASPDRKSDT